MSSNFKQQIASLSPAQIALARRIQDAGLASYSQAVKALATRDDARVSEWKAALGGATKATRDAAVASAQDFRKPVSPAPVPQRPTPPTDWPGGDWESGDADRRTPDPEGDAPVCPRCKGRGVLPGLSACSCADGQRVAARRAADAARMAEAKAAQSAVAKARLAAAPSVSPKERMPAPTGEWGRASCRSGDGRERREHNDEI